jgi:nitroreductase
MDFDELIRKRKSVRSFQQSKVDWKIVLDAIDLANNGPFAGNINNLRYVIVEDENKIKALAKHSNQVWISNAQLVVVVCADDGNVENIYGERGRIYSRQQAGAAINTIMLKLTESGLGSCWVGAYSDELIKNVCGIPAHISVEAIIPVGYEKPFKGEVKKRKREINTTIYWDNWRTEKRPTLFKEPPLRNPNQNF